MPLLVCAIPKQISAMTLPVAGIDSRTNLDVKLGYTYFFDPVSKPSAQPSPEPLHGRLDGVCSVCHLGNHILRAIRGLHITEQISPAFGPKLSAEFLCKARFSDPPLPCQQHVVATSNEPSQTFQVALSIKEVFAAYPSAGR